MKTKNKPIYLIRQGLKLKAIEDIHWKTDDILDYIDNDSTLRQDKKEQIRELVQTVKERTDYIRALL